MKGIASCAPVAVLVLAAVAMSPAPAAAQGLGLGGGLNLSRLVGENQTIVRSEQRTGLNLGGTFSFSLTRALALQPEVYYSQKGQEQEFASGTGPSGLATLSLDYVEVPVLAKITLPGTRSIRPHIAAGPAFAWNVRCIRRRDGVVERGWRLRGQPGGARVRQGGSRRRRGRRRAAQPRRDRRGARGPHGARPQAPRGGGDDGRLQEPGLLVPGKAVVRRDVRARRCAHAEGAESAELLRRGVHVLRACHSDVRPRRMS